MKRGIDVNDAEAVIAFARGLVIECRPENGEIAYYVDGEAPGNNIRTPEVTSNVSFVARIGEVREVVTALLRGMTAHGNLIVEGRDITTAVFSG